MGSLLLGACIGSVKRLVYILLLTVGIGGAFLGWRYWRSHRFDAAIAEAARRYQLPVALIHSVVWQESNFNPDARGRAGELGLMQIREIAAIDWASSEHIPNFDHATCLDPLTNVLAGTWYLKHVLQHYKNADNPLPFALAEYNAGRGNVLKWLAGEPATNSAVFIQKIGFPGTKLYVERITEHYHSLEGESR